MEELKNIFLFVDVDSNDYFYIKWDMLKFVKWYKKIQEYYELLNKNYDSFLDDVKKMCNKHWIEIMLCENKIFSYWIDDYIETNDVLKSLNVL